MRNTGTQRKGKPRQCTQIVSTVGKQDREHMILAEKNGSYWCTKTGSHSFLYSSCRIEVTKLIEHWDSWLICALMCFRKGRQRIYYYHHHLHKCRWSIESARPSVSIKGRINHLWPAFAGESRRAESLCLECHFKRAFWPPTLYSSSSICVLAANSVAL